MSKTVFVVGAGASCEVDLPSGLALRELIAGALNIRFSDYGEPASGDALLSEAVRMEKRRLKDEGRDHQQVIPSAWRIRDAMPLVRSIDQYLDQHRADSSVQLLGKLAIVRTILLKESGSKLSIDASNVNNTIPFAGVGDTWFSGFWQLVSDGCDAEQVREKLKRIAFVVFNYDRCLEHFLYHALRATYYELSDGQVASIMQEIAIYHPYGRVGLLPWQTGWQHRVQFGGKPSVRDLFALAGQVRTFTESVRSDEIVGMHSWLREAETVVYLGFAFHRQNLDLLWPSDIRPVKSELQIGSSYGISDDSQNFIKLRLASLSGADYKNLRLYNMKCGPFFEHNWYQLSSRI